MRPLCYTITIFFVLICSGVAFSQTPVSPENNSEAAVQKDSVDSVVASEPDQNGKTESVPVKSEETSEKPAKKNLPVKKAAIVKNDDKPVKTQQQKKQKKQTQNKITAPVVREANLDLIAIDSDEYKYNRIIGYLTDIGTEKVKDEDSSSENISIKTIEEKQPGEDGLFGYSKKTTDTAIKFVIVFLIFIVFVLYRVRSNKSTGKVMRRYSRK